MIVRRVYTQVLFPQIATDRAFIRLVCETLLFRVKYIKNEVSKLWSPKVFQDVADKKEEKPL